jgi:hypothetical protein
MQTGGFASLVCGEPATKQLPPNKRGRLSGRQVAASYGSPQQVSTQARATALQSPAAAANAWQSSESVPLDLGCEVCYSAPAVARHERTLEQVLDGRRDANVRFEDLRALLLEFGFVERTRGSHHMFGKSGVEQQINLQRDGAKAKPYQVRQVREMILRYNLRES